MENLTPTRQNFDISVKKICENPIHCQINVCFWLHACFTFLVFRFQEQVPVLILISLKTLFSIVLFFNADKFEN